METFTPPCDPVALPPQDLLGATSWRRSRYSAQDVTTPPSWSKSRQATAGLFADQNKDASRQRHDIDEEHARSKLQTESEQAMKNQIKREQNHADVFVEFHDVEPADCLLT
jgi:hypothetical protein